MSNSNDCRHCGPLTNHIYVCNCGHRHNDHVFTSGCKIPGCQCERYNQSKKLKPGDIAVVAKPISVKNL